MWTSSEVVERIADALAAREASLRLEQAVHGLDSLNEVRCHAVLTEELLKTGGVLREVPYPGRSVPGTLRRERDRCDLVLLPPGETRLVDPLREANARADAAGTLFEAAAPPPEPGAQPEVAYWLEVKVVSQMTTVHGCPTPNRTYASELIRAVTTDLSKLAAQPRIEHGGLALLLFSDSERTGEHDATLTCHRCAAAGVSMRTPEIRHVPIVDRIGNACCTTVIIPRRSDR